MINRPTRNGRTNPRTNVKEERASWIFPFLMEERRPKVGKPEKVDKMLNMFPFGGCRSELFKHGLGRFSLLNACILPHYSTSRANQC